MSDSTEPETDPETDPETEPETDPETEPETESIGADRIHMRWIKPLAERLDDLAEERHGGSRSQCLRQAFIEYEADEDENTDPVLHRLGRDIADLSESLDEAAGELDFVKSSVQGLDRGAALPTAEEDRTETSHLIAVLDSIGNGSKRVREISDDTGLPAVLVSELVHDLEETNQIQREEPNSDAPPRFRKT